MAFDKIKNNDENSKKVLDEPTQQLYADVEAVLITPEGRNVLQWIMGLTGTDEAIHSGSTNDTFFRLGKRAVGEKVAKCIAKANPSYGGQIIITHYTGKGESNDGR